MAGLVPAIHVLSQWQRRGCPHARAGRRARGNAKGPTTMALPTNTFTTYSAAGNREDLSDMIYRVDPTDTPFMTGIEKAKATAVNHEWQTQALAAASGSNQQLEGDDAVADPTTPTVRLRHPRGM